MRIRVCDLETSGVEPTAHVVEIAAWDVLPAQGPVGILFVGQSFVKPPVSIPPIASAVHHLIDEDVQDAEPWEKVYPAFIDDAVDAYAAHNSRFDGQWLTPEVLHGKPLIDTYRAALRLWPDAPSHSNQALRYFLKPPGLNRHFANAAHRAKSDAYVTAHLLMLILQQPKVTLDGLVKCSSRPALLPRVRFGKHTGKKWDEIERSYLDWIMGQKDMSEDVRFTAEHELARRDQEERAIALFAAAMSS